MANTMKAYISAPLFSMLMLSMVSSYAMAAECYTPSPNLTSSGNDYYSLDKPDLSNENKNKINALFHAMAGKWKGDMQYLECRGPDSAPRIIYRTAAVTAKTRLNSETGLEINAEKHNIENRSKKPEHLTLIGKTPAFDLEFISGNHVVFAERHRRLNQVGKKEAPPKKATLVSALKSMLSLKKKKAEPIKQKTSRITETIVEIEVNGGSLNLARHYYTNGVYIGEERWQMQRD